MTSTESLPDLGNIVKPAYHAVAVFISRINNKRIAFADMQDYQANAAAEPEHSSKENTVQPAELN